MKKLLLFLFFVPLIYAQEFKMVGDTTTLKSLIWNQPVLLLQYGGGTFDRTGGGIFQVIDSTYAEGANAFDHPWTGKQWARIGLIDPSPTLNALTVNGTITGANGETIANSTDGQWDIAGAVVAYKDNATSFRNKGLSLYGNSVQTYQGVFYSASYIDGIEGNIGLLPQRLIIGSNDSLDISVQSSNALILWAQDGNHPTSYVHIGAGDSIIFSPRTQAEANSRSQLIIDRVDKTVSGATNTSNVEIDVSSGELVFGADIIFSDTVKSQTILKDAILGANQGLLTLITNGTPQLLLEDSDADNGQNPFWYMQSANNGSKGIFYLGYGNRVGGLMYGYTDLMVIDSTTLDFTGTVDVDSLVIDGGATIVGNIDITGNLDIDSLISDGGISISGNVLADTLNVDSIKVVAGVSIGGNIDVDGQTTLDSLTTSQGVTITGNVDITGNLDADSLISDGGGSFTNGVTIGGSNAIVATDTTAFNSKTLTTAQLAYKIDYADTTSSIAKQWELDGKIDDADTTSFRNFSDSKYAVKTSQNFAGNITSYTYNFATDTSTSDQPNIYDLVNSNIGDYATGIITGTVINWIAATANTGASDILVNGYAQKNLFKMHDIELASGDIEVGQACSAMYDGTQWQLLSQIAQ